MRLNTKQKQQLKAKAHGLKPIVFTGLSGLTENVKNEVNRGLEDHELIKIRIQENDREIRKEIFQQICEAVSGEAIQLIGGVGVIYRKNLNKSQSSQAGNPEPVSKKKSAKSRSFKEN